MLPLLFVLFLGLLLQGGDWPPAAFLIRFAPFALAALFLVRRDEATARPTAPDLLVLLAWSLGALSLPRGGYSWASYQWFLHHTAALAVYGLVRAADDPDRTTAVRWGILVLGAAAAEAGIALVQWGILGFARPPGTLQNPNFLAEFVLYGAVAAWVSRSWGAEGRAGRFAIPALAVLFLSAFLAAQSRGMVLVALAAGGGLLARKAGARYALIGIAAAALALVLVPNPLRDRFLGRWDPYAFERLNMWKAAWRISVDHPLGVGLGHFKYFWHAARDPVEGTLIRYARSAATPHSEFFSALAELGFAGGAVFLGFGALGAISLRRALRGKDPIALGATAILLVSYLHSLVDANYHVPGLLLLNAAALGVVSSRLWDPLGERRIQVKGLVRACGLALALAMAGYSGMTLAAEGLESLGRKALKEDRQEEAQRHFLRAAAVDPVRARALDSASAAQFRLYASGRGEEWLSCAIESEVLATLRNPMEYRYHARAGFLYGQAAERSRGRFRQELLRAALRSWDRALALRPHSAELRCDKAFLLRAAGRMEEARELVRAALADEPRFAPGWAMLGELLEPVDGGEAAAAYGKAAEIHREFADDPLGADETSYVRVDPRSLKERQKMLSGLSGR